MLLTLFNRNAKKNENKLAVFSCTLTGSDPYLLLSTTKSKWFISSLSKILSVVIFSNILLVSHILGFVGANVVGSATFYENLLPFLLFVFSNLTFVYFNEVSKLDTEKFVLCEQVTCHTS